MFNIIKLNEGIVRTNSSDYFLINKLFEKLLKFPNFWFNDGLAITLIRILVKVALMAFFSSIEVIKFLDLCNKFGWKSRVLSIFLHFL